MMSMTAQQRERSPFVPFGAETAVLTMPCSRWTPSRLVVIGLLVVLSMALTTRTAAAKTFTVDTEQDGVDSNLADDLCIANVAPGGACTLRAAIQQANATGGPDFIILPDGDYALTIENQLNQDEDLAATGDLDINTNMVISGTSATDTIIRMAIVDGDRVFHLLDEDAVVRLSRVTIRDGLADRVGVIDGGAIRNQGGILELIEVIVTNNRAHRFGGAIEHFGTLTIERSTFTDNVADGLNFSRGGAVSAAQNSLFYVYNSTFYSNTAASRGGAIDVRNNNNEAVINNVTIAGNLVSNTSDPEGGGLYVGSGGGKAEVGNTILYGNIDGNGAPNDCDGQITSLGHNLVGVLTGCTLNGATNEIIGEDPLLGPLQDNGGQTPTFALLDGSPAIDAGNPAALESSKAACRATDQRGVARSAPCDIGAYEGQTLLYVPYLDQ